MKKAWLSLLLISGLAIAADVRISDLPLGSAVSTGNNDVFPYVDVGASVTRKLKLSDLINLPGISSTYAPLNSPTFTGVVTAPSFVGPLIGNVTGNVSGSSSSFTGPLSGDVSGTQSATVVDTVGGKTSTEIANTVDNNTVDVTLEPFGSTPDAKGATITGQDITLQPADDTHPGGVSVGTQTFGGDKTIDGILAADNLTGTNTGDLTLDTFGSTPTSVGLSLQAGQILNMEPADATHPGGVSTTTQSFGGNKTFTGTIAASNFSGSSSGTNSGDVTLGTFGSSPSASGASLSGQILTLQPADATNPGGISTTSQTIPGAKTFSSPITGSLVGNASTATALAANPTDCGPGDFAVAIDAMGNLTCSPGSAAITIGTIDSQTPSADGLVAVSSTIYAQSASATVPGMVNNTTQTFSGAKTFSSGGIVSSILNDTNTVTLLAPAFTIEDNGDPTRKFKFGAGGITTATTRTYQGANVSGTLGILTGATVNHAPIVGGSVTGGQNTIASAGTSGQPLLSAGSSTDPAYGTLGTTYGGTGQDFSASTGFLRVVSGTVSAITNAAATALLDVFVGDSGSGGTKGLVPAPAAGDAAANKVLGAGGGWVVQSGGGGGSLFWVETLNAPSTSVDAANTRIYSYGAGLGQAVYSQIKVPTTYTAGSQINLKTTFYSNDTSGNALLQCVATLIRPGTDTFSSTTNQRTSTNAAITLSGGTQNIPQAVTCDLTSSSGQINGVSVASGNLINVKLTRGTDTATSDINAPVYGTEVTFQ